MRVRGLYEGARKGEAVVGPWRHLSAVAIQVKDGRLQLADREYVIDPWQARGSLLLASRLCW